MRPKDVPRGKISCEKDYQQAAHQRSIQLLRPFLIRRCWRVIYAELCHRRQPGTVQTRCVVAQKDVILLRFMTQNLHLEGPPHKAAEWMLTQGSHESVSKSTMPEGLHQRICGQEQLSFNRKATGFILDHPRR